MDQALSLEARRFPPTDPRANDRVRAHTPRHVNARIDHAIRANVSYYAQAGRDAILARLRELNREWDIDRVLIANFAVLGGITSELGRRNQNVWTHVFRTQQFFLLMHAVIGWCPPTSLFRRLGVRTQKEIAAERAALVELLREKHGLEPAQQ